MSNKKQYGQIDNITGAKKPNSQYGHAYEYTGNQIKRNKKPSSFGMNLLNTALTGTNMFRADKYHKSIILNNHLSSVTQK